MSVVMLRIVMQSCGFCSLQLFDSPEVVIVGASLSEPHMVVTASCGHRRGRDRGPRCLSTLRHLTFCARGRGMVWPGYELYISVTSMAHVHKTETENLSQRREERLLRERESSRNR